MPSLALLSSRPAPGCLRSKDRTVAWGSDWATDGGNPQRTNWQQDETILTKQNVANLKILWKVKLDNAPRQMHSLLPSLIVGRLIVSNQVPEYVGAQQKRFAWVIGVILSASMFVLLIVINAYGPFTGVVCLLCLIFLFFEAVFGICLACKVYRMMYGEKAQYCPGEVCDVKSRQPIQRTSGAQLAIVFAFIVAIFLMVRFFAPVINVPPHDMFGDNAATSASK